MRVNLGLGPMVRLMAWLLKISLTVLLGEPWGGLSVRL